MTRIFFVNSNTQGGETLYNPNLFKPFSFLGVQCQYDAAKIVIVPIPYDATASNQSGARNGPVAIINESLETESFDLDIKSDVSPLVHTTGFLNVFDCPLKMQKTVFEVISKIIKDGKIPVIIGGDHSLTSAAVKAVKENFAANFSVITFDAHSDLKEDYRGNKFSHASVMRRVQDLDIRTFHIGVRSSAKELEEYSEDKKMMILSTRDIMDRKSFTRPEFLKSHSENCVYLSFDFDVYDPSIMATGTPEPDGLNFREVSEILKHILRGRKVIGADFVEFIPLSFQDNSPANLAVRTINRFLNLL